LTHRIHHFAKKKKQRNQAVQARREILVSTARLGQHGAANQDNGTAQTKQRIASNFHNTTLEARHHHHFIFAPNLIPAKSC